MRGFFSGMLRGVSNAPEGWKILRFLFRPRLVCSSLLHLRRSPKVNSANFVCRATQKFATSISNSTPCHVPSSIQAYDVPVYATRYERRLSSVSLSLEEKVRLLSMVDVFEALSEEELRRLAYLARDATYEQGEVLPEPQEGGEKLYVLKEGRVQLFVVLPNEGEITLSVVEAGSIFGEIAVAGQGSGKVRARALLPSLVCTLKTEILEQLIERNPAVALAIVRMLSDRLRQAEVRFAELAHKQVPARLASLILRLSASEGIVSREGIRIDTPYTHQQLATMIGSNREAVTRAMKELREKGAVEVVGRRMHLGDREVLEREAEAQAPAQSVRT